MGKANPSDIIKARDNYVKDGRLAGTPGDLGWVSSRYKSLTLVTTSGDKLKLGRGGRSDHTIVEDRIMGRRDYNDDYGYVAATLDQIDEIKFDENPNYKSRPTLTQEALDAGDLDTAVGYMVFAWDLASGMSSIRNDKDGGVSRVRNMHDPYIEVYNKLGNMQVTNMEEHPEMSSVESALAIMREHFPNSAEKSGYDVRTLIEDMGSIKNVEIENARRILAELDGVVDNINSKDALNNDFDLGN